MPKRRSKKRSYRGATSQSLTKRKSKKRSYRGVATRRKGSKIFSLSRQKSYRGIKEVFDQNLIPFRIVQEENEEENDLRIDSIRFITGIKNDLARQYGFGILTGNAVNPIDNKNYNYYVIYTLNGNLWGFKIEKYNISFPTPTFENTVFETVWDGWKLRSKNSYIIHDEKSLHVENFRIISDITYPVVHAEYESPRRDMYLQLRDKQSDSYTYEAKAGTGSIGAPRTKVTFDFSQGSLQNVQVYRGDSKVEIGHQWTDVTLPINSFHLTDTKYELLNDRRSFLTIDCSRMVWKKTEWSSL